MARKKRRTKGRRRHRIGAMALNANSPLVKFGSIALGYFLGTTINPLINSLVPASFKTNASAGKIIAVGTGGIGALLVFGKGRKSLAKSIAGGLLMGSAIKRATVVFKPGTTDTLGAYATQGQLGKARVMRGYGDVPVIGGYGDVPVIGGQGVGAYTTPGALNGAKVMGSMNPSGSGLMG